VNFFGMPFPSRATPTDTPISQESRVGAEGITLPTPGETYTICDPYLFTMAQWLEQDGVDPCRFPKIIAHRLRMPERPEVQRAISEEIA
jgi:hypothetical protein